MSDFKTQYNAHDRFGQYSVSGERERPNYKPKYSENGAYELVQDGVIHSYDDVQAWLPATDMSNIYEQYLRTGDESLLRRRAAFYGDVTDLPTNYAELQNMLDNADRVFESLPLELRDKFGNSPALFYADGAKANALISDYLKSISPAPTPAPAPTPEGGNENE